jgi:hypothetical protein
MTTSLTNARVHLVDDDTDVRIAGFELFSARRALALLKSRLGRTRILELLADEIEAGDRLMRRHVERSSGQTASGTTVLRAHGISAAQFGRWLGSSFDREDVMLAAHPEHYVVHNEGPGRAHIVETLGEQVVSFFMGGWDESAEVPGSGSSADDGHRSKLALADGTVVGSVATLFTDADDGFTARLSVTLPVTCAPEAVEQHLQHFAVEFHNWILNAARELSES